MSSKMTVKKEAIMARFGGMGFHNSEANVWREMDDVQFNQYVGKVYRELSPGFSRMWGGFPEWTKEEMDAFAEYCEKMQCKVGATIYLTGHCVRYETDEELTAYASNVADRLEYLIYEKGLSNVKIYCMSNELSLDDWGDLAFEMATFKKYHTYLYNEFAHRHLPVYLLATDASPMERWETVEWAIANGMVPISNVFGGHHYVNDFEAEDLDFYKIFKRHCSDVVNMLKPYERRFILGEFGLAQAFKQGQNNINGVKMDVCDAFYNGKESYSALQICEMALAAVNAGVYAMALWTFVDVPNPRDLQYRLNKWGLLRWDDTDYGARDWLYAYGLLVRYFRKNSKPLTISSEDYLLRSGGVVNDDGSFSVAIVNRHKEPVEIDISLENLKSDKALRRYLYDSANVPSSKFADLQDYDELIACAGNSVHVTVPASSIVLLTTDYTDHKPAAITGICAEDGTVTWEASTETEHRYYRVYKGDSADFVPTKENQIASTIATSFTDPDAAPGFYKVESVDAWGNH
jgi:hypothetical protein